MKIEKIEPVYKSTFNSKSNQNKNNNQSKQNKKDKTMRIKLCGLVACAAMLVAGLVSCQQEEIPQSLQYPILFGYSDTRAVADLEDLQDNGFKVYAYFKK